MSINLNLVANLKFRKHYREKKRKAVSCKNYCTNCVCDVVKIGRLGGAGISRQYQARKPYPVAGSSLFIQIIVLVKKTQDFFSPIA